jgi:peptide/nickel transport system ATP-binding protein
MMNELKTRLNTSMILITHDLGIVAQTCDDVCVMYAGEIVEIGSAEEIFNAEKHHPYTRGLFGSIPNLKVDTPRLNPITGLMPDPTNLPSGCKFSPRCPYCLDICRETPPLYHADGEHKILCHLYS